MKIKIENLQIESSKAIAIRQQYDQKWQEMLRSQRPKNEHVRMDAALKFGSIADKLEGIRLP